MAEAETGSATKWIFHCQLEVARFAFVTALSLHVLFASAGPSAGRTIRRVVEGAGNFASAILATGRCELIEAILTSITELATNARFALALAIPIALPVHRANFIALTWSAVEFTRVAPMVGHA